VEGDELVVTEILVGDQHLVIGKADGAISLLLVCLLDLLGRLLSVREGGVAVEIDLVKIALFG